MTVYKSTAYPKRRLTYIASNWVGASFVRRRVFMGCHYV